MVKSRRGAVVGTGLLALLVLASFLGSSAAAGSFSTPKKLPGPGKRSGFGASVSISADGGTVLVGAPIFPGGRAAWVYTRRGSGWSSVKLKAGSPVLGIRTFGASVALSANARTAVVGAPSANQVWVYRQAGGGVWVGSRLKPVGAKGNALFGHSVAVTADGSMIAVGGPGDSGKKGAVWLFRRSGANYAQVGEKLTPRFDGGGGLGSSVSIQNDPKARGVLILAGAPDFDGGRGHVVAFVYSPPSNLREDPPPVRPGKELSKGSRFGAAISSAFYPVAIGAPGEAGGKGAVYFSVQRIEGTAANGHFGASVARASNLLLVGGYGATKELPAARLFKDGRLQDVLTGGARSSKFFGLSVALSTDSFRAVVGDPREANDRGGVWIFDLPPQVDSLSPENGPAAGGTTVTINGRGLRHARSVTFDGRPATSFTVVSPTEIRAVAPPGTGTADVVVTGSNGLAAEKTLRFNYFAQPVITAITPANGLAAGGTNVTIDGNGFFGITRVSFGSNTATFTLDPFGRITAAAPPGQPGTVDVTVTGIGGTSAATAQSKFTYTAPPTVVDFDDIVTGGPGQVELTKVNTQYAARGVTFNDLTAFDYSKGAAIAGFAHSGSVALEPCIGILSCTQPVAATFSSPQRGVCAWVGFSTSPDGSIQVQLRALDAGSAVIGTATATLYTPSGPVPIRTPLLVNASSATIAKMEISLVGAANYSLAVDDVTFAADAPLDAC